MQTLYAIHINNVNQVSVDVYSDRHAGAAKWRVYFAVRPQTVARLRRIYQRFPKRFYINREWSPRRWKMYKEWAVSGLGQLSGVGSAISLDYLETKEPPDAIPQ